MRAVPLARSRGAELPNPQELSQAPFTSAPPHPAVSIASSDYSPRAGDFEERAEQSLTSCPTTGSGMPCWRTLRQTSFVQVCLHSVGREVTRQALWPCPDQSVNLPLWFLTAVVRERGPSLEGRHSHRPVPSIRSSPHLFPFTYPGPDAS